MLNQINSPIDLKKLDINELNDLSNEFRQVIIKNLAVTGGHLASNLGAIEITLALHYVFNSPYDKIIFDVGHQAYAHKLLTGRKNLFHTLRQYKGLSGFVNPNESEHDAFLAGHSSTSISLGVGMAIARDNFKQDNHIIVVIGDGGLTGGMALEALNHLGHIQKNILIILNDNEMSISNNVGGIYHYMKRLKETFFYKDLKDKINIIENNLTINHLNPKVLNLINDVKEEASLRFETPGIVFEKLGINYFGPTDGHDLKAIIKGLEAVKNINGPKLLHLITQKGKGFAPAEADSIKYHGVSSAFLKNLEPVTSEKIDPTASVKTPTYSDIFVQNLIEFNTIEPNMVALTPATAEGSGLVKFGNLFPNRFFDVAICEQHAVTCAAGMAKSGLKPVVSIYSTFLQRAIDQIIHDIAILNLNVLFCIDRAGIVEDGETHQGVFDISILRSIPNLKIIAPKDCVDLKNMIYSALKFKYTNGPIAIRYPRDKAYNYNIDLFSKPFELIDYTKWEFINKANKAKIAILANGSMVEQLETGLKSQPNLTSLVSVVDARCIKPLDEKFLIELTSDDYIETVITVEEGSVAGGFGSSILEWYHQYLNSETDNFINLKSINKRLKIINLGIKDNFIEHGARMVLLNANGLSSDKLTEYLSKLANANMPQSQSNFARII